jgi:hypothetical protein
MPVPGGEPDDLDRLEAAWSDRLIYATGTETIKKGDS